MMRLTTNFELKVGKLGSFDFPSGYYLYFGSALNGLRGRLRRHLRRHKSYHWHADYLTSVATVSQVWWAEGAHSMECSWADAALDNPSAAIPAPGFGSSDCLCPSHLVHLDSWSEVQAIRDRLAAESQISTCSPRRIRGGKHV